MNYKDFKFLSFDCYGTLIDWESGIWNAFQPVILFNSRNDLTREKVLRNFALLESEQQKQTPSMLYSEILSSRLYNSSYWRKNHISILVISWMRSKEIPICIASYSTNTRSQEACLSLEMTVS